MVDTTAPGVADKSTKVARHLFHCQCDHGEHIVIFENDPDWGLTIKVALDHEGMGLWTRIKVAYRFLLGKPCYGYHCWAEFLITPDNARQIRNLLENPPNIWRTNI